MQGHQGYGRKNENCHFAEEDFRKFDLSKFDERNLEDHQMKVLVCFGSLFGLHGNNRHTNLMVEQISEGYYQANHPSLFPNLTYRGLKDFKARQDTPALA